jgi:hypothetical protein
MTSDKSMIMVGGTNMGSVIQSAGFKWDATKCGQGI